MKRQVSIFRPVYSKINSSWGVWLWKDQTNQCDVVCNGKSIYNQITTLVSWLGLGIAWGWRYNGDQSFYIENDGPARQRWIGQMEIWR